MYDTMYFEALASQELKDSFPLISGILRLAVKYLITSYRKRCIGILSCYFPSGATWTFPKDFPGIRPSQCGAMISLARELNLLALLPSAFLILASYLTISSKTESIYAMPSLTTQDKADLCHGTLGLLTAQADDMFPFPHFFTPAETCQASGNCSVEAGSKNYRRQPYRVFIFVHEDFLNVKAVVCEACWVNVKNIFREGRQKTWERLPEIFHLGKDWNELRRIQDNDYS
ncbi:hypothetical protein BD626DRAFT_499550 [Schizophyllum amplum]|uniref:Uncharacterized protein n=1 Tax=Schizophyllum amplum TaxID=97359 RepID=A0A550CB58_9AGAR|nr:hypothetical protein BD626DRAFT_499550 [Auriculariopsis ampla]